MKLTTLPWLLLGISLNALAQLLLKAGAERISGMNFNWANVVPISMEIGTNPYILSGIILYGISVLVWIGVLSRVDVSIAYPMISLGYIINAIAAHYLLGEAITKARMSGILIILLGVYFVARS